MLCKKLEKLIWSRNILNLVGWKSCRKLIKLFLEEYNRGTNKKINNLKNRGGLWSALPDAFSLFRIAKIAFRKSTKILN